MVSMYAGSIFGSSRSVAKRAPQCADRVHGKGGVDRKRQTMFVSGPFHIIKQPFPLGFDEHGTLIADRLEDAAKHHGFPDDMSACIGNHGRQPFIGQVGCTADEIVKKLDRLAHIPPPVFERQ